MRVLVTGATGFTGSFVVPALVERGHDVACYVRSSSPTARLPLDRISLCYGDLSEPALLEAALRGQQVLVNLASLGFGHAPDIVNAALGAGIRRAVFFSTTAIFTRLDSRSKAIRLAAEEAIRSSRLDYTILRPTMIYGTSRDRNLCRLIRFVKRWRFVPVPGAGQALQQPVYVEDLARAVVRVLDTKATVGKEYNLSGARAVSFSAMIDTVAGLLEIRAVKVHLPVTVLAAAVSAAKQASIPLPVSAEQVLRLTEDKAFDHAEAARDFGYAPRSLQEGILLELREMGLA
jgi:nucleoside-diphosphate-sugar epimerase